jgi:ribonuclease D
MSQAEGAPPSQLEPRLVAGQDDLGALLAELSQEPVLAVDTEAASFHRHLDRIYLIQVSTRDRTAIIDPLAVEDLGGFGALLSNPAVEVVFHDADYDLRLFDLQYGYRANRLFDTRVAAELLSEPGLSLAALLEKHLGVKVDKRYQRADWSARPLTPAMLAYAAGDTSHLVTLRDLLAEQLTAAGRMAWALEEFEELTKVRWTNDPDRDPGWLRIKGAKQLEPRPLAILRELHQWRHEVAQRTDRAEFRILGNEALLAIARQAPTTVEALAAIKGVGKETAERRGRALISAVRRGQRLPEKDLPQVEHAPRRQREPEVEARLARLKGARTTITGRLGLAPGVICPNSVLENIARRVPETLESLAGVPGIRRWQVANFGDELLAAVRNGKG